MIYAIVISVVMVWAWAMLTPWSRVAGLGRRCISRVRRRLSALVEQMFAEKSDHIPQHKSGKV